MQYKQMSLDSSAIGFPDNIWTMYIPDLTDIAYLCTKVMDFLGVCAGERGLWWGKHFLHLHSHLNYICRGCTAHQDGATHTPFRISEAAESDIRYPKLRLQLAEWYSRFPLAHAKITCRKENCVIHKEYEYKRIHIGPRRYIYIYIYASASLSGMVP